MTQTQNQNPGCMATILGIFKRSDTRSPAGDENLPYRLRDDFLSPAEASFYHILKSVVASKAIIFTKVRLADVFYVSRPHENASYFNRISPRHVDYLLCEPGTLQPIMGIELDDSSHASKKRVERVEFVDRVFQVGGLPLVRFPAKYSYSHEEIASRVLRWMEEDTESESLVDSAGSYKISPGTNNANEYASSVSTIPQPPFCPKCGSIMVLRTASRGERKGDQFYGCSNYPNCRTVLPLEGGMTN